MPKLLLLDDELVLGESVENHPERSIGSGELQIYDSVEDILVKETHTRTRQIGKRRHFNSSFLAAMELIMNIPKCAALSDSPQVNQ